MRECERHAKVVQSVAKSMQQKCMCGKEEMFAGRESTMPRQGMFFFLCA